MTQMHRVALMVFILANVSLAQQILVLNGGTQLKGRYDGGKADTVRFIDEQGSRHEFNISEIQSLLFNSPAPPVSTDSDRDSIDPAETTYPERVFEDTDETPGTGWTRHAMIPAGTEVAVRTIDPIDVRKPDPRRHYLASVERDVRDSKGNVVLPQGAQAHLIVHEVEDGEIAIDLRSVSVSGRRYLLNADDITNTKVKDGPGANKRTAKFLGGGAVLGTVLGAIAGGGRGAAIGALAGGAAGAGTQVLTRGKALRVPSETILTFQLERPVNLYY